MTCTLRRLSWIGLGGAKVAANKWNIPYVSVIVYDGALKVFAQAYQEKAGLGRPV